MTAADKVTAVRLVLAPFFFVVYLGPAWFSMPASWTVPVLWVLFIVAEITDLIDGKLARSRNEVSDFGKLFDPFADTLVRITYFLCFVVDGILPSILLLVVLYREFGILFLRTLMMKHGIAMGASFGGKIKAVAYMATGVVALLASSSRRLGLNPDYFTILKTTAIVFFLISVVLSLSSFREYFRTYKNAGKK